MINQLIAIKEFQLPQNADLDVISQLVDTLIAAKWK